METKGKLLGVSPRGWLSVAIFFTAIFINRVSWRTFYLVLFVLLLPLIAYDIVEMLRSKSFSGEKDYRLLLFSTIWCIAVTFLYRRASQDWVLKFWYVSFCWLFLAFVPRQTPLADLKQDIFAVGVLIIVGCLPLYLVALASVFTGRLMYVPLLNHPIGIQTAGRIADPILVFLHHNPDARFASFVILFSIYGFAIKKKLWQRAFFVFSIVIGLMTLVHTQSRAIYIGLSLAIGMMACRWIYLRFADQKWRIPAGIVAAALVFFLVLNGMTLIFDIDISLAVKLQGNSAQTAEETSDEAQLQSRVETEGQFAMFNNGRDDIWKGVLSFLKDHPRYLLTGTGGTGEASFALAAEEHPEIAVHSLFHNSYLGALAIGGIPLLLAVLAYLVVLLKPCLRIFFRKETEENRGMFVLPAFILMMLAVGIPEYVLFAVAGYANLIFYLLCGAVMHDDRLHRQSLAEKR